MYNWLSQFDLTLSSASNYIQAASLLNSQEASVSVTVQTKCNRSYCRGFPYLSIRALFVNHQLYTLFKWCFRTPINVNHQLCAVGLSLLAS